MKIFPKRRKKRSTGIITINIKKTFHQINQINQISMKGLYYSSYNMLKISGVCRCEAAVFSDLAVQVNVSITFTAVLLLILMFIGYIDGWCVKIRVYLHLGSFIVACLHSRSGTPTLFYFRENLIVDIFFVAQPFVIDCHKI